MGVNITPPRKTTLQLRDILQTKVRHSLPLSEDLSPSLPAGAYPTAALEGEPAFVKPPTLEPRLPES